MARTPSTMIPLGTPAPDFRLPDTNRASSSGSLSRDEAKGPKGLLVLFICNHCPFVVHIREKLSELGAAWMTRGLGVVAISSNDAATHPADAPDQMTREAQNAGYRFPYLYDESQSVARAYRAACTPDFYLFGPDLHLVYRGQFDDARPGNGLPVTGRDLAAAVEALLAGSQVSEEQRPSMGCNIKWKTP